MAYAGSREAARNPLISPSTPRLIRSGRSLLTLIIIAGEDSLAPEAEAFGAKVALARRAGDLEAL